MRVRPKVIRWIADSLNNYAALEDAGELVPNHTPGSPMFWFGGLARETAAYWRTSEGQEMLSPSARRYFKRLGNTAKSAK